MKQNVHAHHYHHADAYAYSCMKVVGGDFIRAR
jgi:hypothetical protein